MRIQRRARDEIHPTPGYRSQLILQRDERRQRNRALEFHQHIEIARLTRVAARATDPNTASERTGQRRSIAGSAERSAARISSLSFTPEPSAPPQAAFAMPRST